LKALNFSHFVAIWCND